jgi:hypothetical protein
MTMCRRMMALRVPVVAGITCWGLLGCAGTPPPDWQMNAKGSLDRAVQAQLSGNDRVATAEYERARAEIARTGRIDLMARAELTRCAAQVAALQFEPCAGFAALQADAPPAERAYAAYLAGAAAERSLLPAAQQALAQPARGAEADLAALRDTQDPLSRLVAAALWLHSGRATAPVMALAVETASSQGWRRPLLAWLQAQQALARQSGDEAQAAQLGRRIELVLQGGARP